MFDITTIVSAVLATVTAGGWLRSSYLRRREDESHRAELEKTRAEVSATLRESETKYTREALEIYTNQVIKPLRDEIQRLRDNQVRFQAAINAAPSCKHYPDCVVLRRLQGDEDNNRAS